MLVASSSLHTHIARGRQPHQGGGHTRECHHRVHLLVRESLDESPKVTVEVVDRPSGCRQLDVKDDEDATAAPSASTRRS